MADTKEVIAQLVKEPPGPFSSDQAIPTAIIIVVAMAGGFVSFYRKWRDGNARAFNLVEMIGELVVSGICGLFVFWALLGFGANMYFAAAGCGVAGHMGSRALFVAEKLLENAAYRWFGNDRRDDSERRDQERRDP